MSDVPIAAGDNAGRTFNARIMLLVTGIGSLAFIAMLVLGAYAPDLRSGHDGGSHALSNAATGFSGLVRLADQTGRHPVIVRAISDLDSEDLAVVTPEDPTVSLDELLNKRGPRATLIILPKWSTVADASHAGWVRVRSLDSNYIPENILAPDVKLNVHRSRGSGKPLRNVGLAGQFEGRFVAPAVVQSIKGNNLQPLIVTARGEIVLARVGGRPLYVLGDPDVLNNHAMGDEGQARAALALLDFLNSNGADSVLFDVTSNGLGHSKSPLRLAFDPPFLAVTLIIFVAMILAAWQALIRFGAVSQRPRAIAFGKAALVDNSAALIRKAGREARLGARYAEAIRDRASALFRLPHGLNQEMLDVRLESLNPHRSFRAAAGAVSKAQSRDELVNAARQLNQWLKEVQE